MALIGELRKRAASDLEIVQQTGIKPCKSLKRKPEMEPLQMPETKSLKSEKSENPESHVKKEQQMVPYVPAVKQEQVDRTKEPKDEVVSKLASMEDMLSKVDLVELHGLKILPRNSEGKKKGIFCPHCDCSFEGPNRAKVKQHTDGQQHRSNWRGAQMAPKVEASVEPRKGIHAETKEVKDGTCQGLRLGSSFGKKTRLGSDLAEVWRCYSKYAYLERILWESLGYSGW